MASRANPPAGCTRYLQRLDQAGPTESAIAVDDRVTLALAAMTSRESEVILVKLTELLIASQNASALLANTRRLLDATRSDGSTGYVAAAHEALAFPWQVRLAHWLHRKVG